MKPILIEFKTISEPGRGKLTAIEGELFEDGIPDIPFEIKRIFYIYDDVPFNGRGGHAHKACKQVLIAIKGAFDVVVNQGEEHISYRLSSPQIGLLIPPMTWVWLSNWMPGSICLCIASDHYQEWDYIRSFEEFCESLRVYERAA